MPFMPYTGDRRYDFTHPRAKAVTPDEPAAQVQSAPDPFAWASTYANIGEYAADVTRRMRAGEAVSNPVQDANVYRFVSDTPATGRQVYYRNPFNAQEPFSEKQWSQFQEQMNLVHQPIGAAAAKQFDQIVMQHSAGTMAKTPITDPLNIGRPYVDQIARERPELLSPEARAVYQKQTGQWDRMFTDMMTRKSGSRTLQDVKNAAATALRENPLVEQHARDRMLDMVMRDPGLRKEYDQERLDATFQGNQTFRMMEPREQAQIKRDIALLRSDQEEVAMAAAERMGLIRAAKDIAKSENAANGIPAMGGATGFKKPDFRALADQMEQFYGLTPVQDESRGAPQGQLLTNMGSPLAAPKMNFNMVGEYVLRPNGETVHAGVIIRDSMRTADDKTQPIEKRNRAWQLARELMARTGISVGDVRSKPSR
jgi:hypothetical protein